MKVSGAGSPRIAALAVSDPERSYSQEEVLDQLGLRDDPFATGIFSRCGVERRHLGLLAPGTPGTLQGRTARGEDQMLEHAVRATDRLEIDPQEIGIVVSSSLYSLAGPTLAHHLVEHYDMSPSTDKYHVVGVGCASAVPLVRLVAGALAADPGKKGLLVAADSMSGLLTSASNGDARAKVVGSAIFGDGCAAAVIESGNDGSGPTVLASAVHQIPGTLGVVSMALSDDDSYLHLERDLPDVAAAGLAALVEDFLAPLDLNRAAIDHWVVHPGGRRIIGCVQKALSLSRDDVRTSYDILAQHGNVGTPSIFYVLKETIERNRPAPGDRCLIVTIGPGVTVGLMLLSF